MIAERPWLGHGIGTFYLASPRYARADDPLGAKPEFAHNAFLQFAAELGVPALLTWLILPGIALAHGLHSLRMLVRNGPNQQYALRLATALALLGLLLTQLTSNSVNVFLSNQLFLWLFVAALLPSGQGRSKRSMGS
jgi:O-antigen ligase